MNKTIYLVIIIILSINAQPILTKEIENSKYEIISIIRKQAGYKFCYDDFVLETINYFKGTKYGSGGQNCPANKVLINTKSFDCVTFVENFLAIAYATNELKNNPFALNEEIYSTYLKYIMILRYYENKPTNSWDNRINYFTEQLFKLCEKGLMIDLQINAIPYEKKINYISTHKYKFRGIKNWKKVLQKEKYLTNRPKFYYPIKDIQKCYAPIAQDGDIVALTTTVEGLEVSHTGIITKKGNKIFFSHASQKHKKLVVEEDFIKYLKSRTTITGIMIFRPIFN